MYITPPVKQIHEYPKSSSEPHVIVLCLTGWRGNEGRIMLNEKSKNSLMLRITRTTVLSLSLKPVFLVQLLMRHFDESKTPLTRYGKFAGRPCHSRCFKRPWSTFRVRAIHQRKFRMVRKASITFGRQVWARQPLPQNLQNQLLCQNLTPFPKLLYHSSLKFWF
jgi:hypothetical protein